MTQTHYIIGSEEARAFRRPVYLKDSGELIGFCEMDVKTKHWRWFLAKGGPSETAETLQEAAAKVYDAWLWDGLA